MSGKAKAKKVHPEEDPSLCIHVGKNELRVGTRVEALDYQGKWYAAKILRIRLQKKKEVLVHFDRWSAKWDVWLPYNSNKIRFPKESKSKEKEWRVGERVLAKWTLDKKMYPATVSKTLNGNNVEVVFFDGVRKQFHKNSIQADTEKLYRQFEDTRKTLMAEPKKVPLFPTAEEAQLASESSGVRSKRRLTEPAAMADYVTDLHRKKKGTSQGSDLSASEDDVTKSQSVHKVTHPVTTSLGSTAGPPDTVKVSPPAVSLTITKQKDVQNATPLVGKKARSKSSKQSLTEAIEAKESIACENTTHCTTKEKTPTDDSPLDQEALDNQSNPANTYAKGDQFGSDKLKRDTDVPTPVITPPSGESPPVHETSESPPRQIMPSAVGEDSPEIKIVKRVSASGSVEIVKKKNKSYMMFPIMTASDEPGVGGSLKSEHKVKKLKRKLDNNELSSSVENIAKKKKSDSTRVCTSVGAKTGDKMKNLKEGDGVRGSCGKNEPVVGHSSYEELQGRFASHSKKAEEDVLPRSSIVNTTADRSPHDDAITVGDKNSIIETTTEQAASADNATVNNNEPIQTGNTTSLRKSKRERKPGAQISAEAHNDKDKDDSLGSSGQSFDGVSPHEATRRSSSRMIGNVNESPNTDSSNPVQSPPKVERHVKAAAVSNQKKKKLRHGKEAIGDSKSDKEGEEARKFERRFELFKLKWKEEKERRRQAMELLQNDSDNDDKVVLSDVTSDVVVSSAEDLTLKPTERKVSHLRQIQVSSKRPVQPVRHINKTKIQRHPRIKQTPTLQMKREKKNRSASTKLALSETPSYSESKGEISSIEKDVTPVRNIPLLMPEGVTKDLKETSTSEECTVPPSASVVEPATTLSKVSIVTSVASVSAKRPRGRPKGRKQDPVGADTSRTPHIGETLSFASMVTEQRPSQMNRSSSMEKGHSSVRNYHPSCTSTAVHLNQDATQVVPEIGVAPNQVQLSLSLAKPSFVLTGQSVSQILASKIQKRVRHQRRPASYGADAHISAGKALRHPGTVSDFAPVATSATSQNLTASPNDESLPTSGANELDDIIVVEPSNVESESNLDEEPIATSEGGALRKPNELDLTGIKLNSQKTYSSSSGVIKRKRSLDFITGRLNERRRSLNSISDVLNRKPNPSPEQSKIIRQATPPHSSASTVRSEQIPLVRTCTPGSVRQRTISDPYSQPLSPPFAVHSNLSAAALSNNGTVRISFPGSHHHQIFPPGYIPIRTRYHQVPFSPSPMQQLQSGQGLMYQQQISPFRASAPLSDHDAKCMCQMCVLKRQSIPLDKAIQQSLFRPTAPLHGQHMRYNQPGIVHGTQQPAGRVSDTTLSSTTLSSFRSIKPKLDGSPGMVDDSIVKVTKIDLPDGSKRDANASDKTLLKEQKSNLKMKNKSSDTEGGSTEKKKRKRIRQKDGAVIDSLRTRRSSEKVAEKSGLAPKEFSVDVELTDFKCPYRGCTKAFRKRRLLEYHIQYFHTVKPLPKRVRSSGSLSSSESNPPSNLTSPVPLSAEAAAMVAAAAAVRIPSLEAALKDEKITADDSTSVRSGYTSVTSDGESMMFSDESSDTDSESEVELPSVDDCIKCICEDEDETGFMIQCEQCITWQHGECVGYTDQNDVPSFYLCHICSNPKGLKRSAKYHNDYTWFKQGRLPGSTSSGSEKLRGKTHVIAEEDQETFENIMLATHTMMTELYNIHDVLQGVKAKLLLARDPADPLLKMWLPKQTDSVSTAEPSSTSSQDLKDNSDSTEQQDKRSGEIQTNTGSGVTSPKNAELAGKPLGIVMTDGATLNNMPNSTSSEVASDKTSDPKPVSGFANESDKKTLASSTTLPSKLSALHEADNKSSERNVVDATKNHVNVCDTSLTSARETENISVDHLNGQKELQSVPSPDRIPKKTHSTEESLSVETEAKPSIELPLDVNSSASEEQSTVPNSNSADSCYKSDFVLDIRGNISVEEITEPENDEHRAAQESLLEDVARLEKEVSSRLDEIDKEVTVLEREFDSLDRSDEVIKRLQARLQLPDLSSLLKMVENLKWLSIIDEKKQQREEKRLEAQIPVSESLAVSVS